jgi:hypothetical protein
MKYTFLISQVGVVGHGLLGKVDVLLLCLLDYIFGWFFCAKARRITRDGREFVWLHYGHAVQELPLLFNPGATLATRKNQLTKMVSRLRAAGLLDTLKVGRDSHLRPSALAAALSSAEDKPGDSRIVTPVRDEIVTSSRDDTVTPKRDDSGPPSTDETTIRETTIKDPNPHSPPKGDCVKESQSLLDAQCEQIYAEYPRKVGKPTALRAIRRACARFSFEHLLERTRLYARTVNAPQEFIPHPSTWFNQHRFSDDPSTWRRTAPVNGNRAKLVPPRQFNQSDYRQPTSNF